MTGFSDLGGSLGNVYIAIYPVSCSLAFSSRPPTLCIKRPLACLPMAIQTAPKGFPVFKARDQPWAYFIRTHPAIQSYLNHRKIRLEETREGHLIQLPAQDRVPVQTITAKCLSKLHSKLPQRRKFAPSCPTAFYHLLTLVCPTSCFYYLQLERSKEAQTTSGQTDS